MNVALVGSTTQSMVEFRGQLIKELTDRHHTVYCYVSDLNKKNEFLIRQIGAKPVLTDLDRSGLNFFNAAENVVKLTKDFKKRKISHCLCFFAKPVLIGALSARMAGVQNITLMLEGMGVNFTKPREGLNIKRSIMKRFQLLMYTFVFQFATRIVVLNLDDARELNLGTFSLYQDKTILLDGIGVDLQHFRYADFPKLESNLTEVSFIFIGRLLRDKGIYDFIEAATSIKKTSPRAIFRVVGDTDSGNPSSLTSKQVECIASSGVVDFFGFQSDVFKWIASSDVLVLPSYREGFPKVVMESCAIGRPAIVADVPGSRSAVIDGVNGFLYHPGDVSSLEFVMRKFLNDPMLANRMSMDCRSLAERRFDGEEKARELANIVFS